jgi:hypothetical protein
MGRLKPAPPDLYASSDLYASGRLKPAPTYVGAGLQAALPL